MTLWLSHRAGVFLGLSEEVLFYDGQASLVLKPLSMMIDLYWCPEFEQSARVFEKAISRDTVD